MIDATLSAFYVLPKIAIFPIMMLIFPDPFGEGPKVAVVRHIGFFPGGDQHHGWRPGHRDRLPRGGPQLRSPGLEALQARHPARRSRSSSRPQARPGTALIVIIAVEFVRAKTGIGFLTFYYWEILAPEKMYAASSSSGWCWGCSSPRAQGPERLVMPCRREERSRSSRSSDSETGDRPLSL